MTRTSRLLFVAALALARPALAYDLADGRLTIAGFGQASVGLTDGNNTYGLGHRVGFGDPDFTLLLAVRPIDELFFSAQVDLNPNTFGLDWVFAEYRYSDTLHLRLGKVKQPFGLFGETRDVGTLRPFFSPAQSVYLERTELNTDGVIGLGLNGRLDSEGGWGLAYDVYGGQLQLSSDDLLDQLAGRKPLYAGGTVKPLTEYNTGVVGGRLWLTTPIDGLSVLLSGYASFFTSDSETDIGNPETKIAVGPSVEYLTEKWMVRAEVLFLYHEKDMRRVAGYAEAGYFITPHIEPALRVEFSDVKDFGARDTSFMHHKEAAVALNYWFTRSMVVRLEYHFSDGNLIALPDHAPDAAISGRALQLTNAVLLGAQFSF